MRGQLAAIALHVPWLVPLAVLAVGCGDPEQRTRGVRSAPLVPHLTYHVGIPVEEAILPGVDGTTHSIGGATGRILVLEFWSCRCPIVAKSEKARRRMIETYAPRGVDYFAVNANRDEYPDNILEYLADLPTTYPVLFDPWSEVTYPFNASRITQVFVLGPFGVARFVGSPMSREQLKRDVVERMDWLEEALDALLAGRPPDPAIRPLFGNKIRRARQP